MMPLPALYAVGLLLAHEAGHVAAARWVGARVDAMRLVHGGRAVGIRVHVPPEDPSALRVILLGGLAGQWAFACSVALGAGAASGSGHAALALATLQTLADWLPLPGGLAAWRDGPRFWRTFRKRR